MTIEDIKPDEEPTSPQETGEVKSPEGKAPWSSLNSIIQEQDIKSVKDFKLVSKMLLGEINRLIKEVGQLNSLTEDYNKKNTELAVLKERLGAFNVRSFLFSIGGLLGGVAFIPNLSTSQEIGVVLLCVICFMIAMLNPDWLNNLFGKK
ncbi:MAG: hypothetical protein WC264_01925 [Candidatus Paceibacterota bacterium]|jgi:hypothetical protein